MKCLFLLITTGLALSVYAPGQARKTKPAQKAKRVGSETRKALDLKPVRIEKWGVKSLSLPADLVQIKETASPGNNHGVTFTEYSRFWRRPLKDKAGSAFDVNFFVTTWNHDFTKVTGLKPEAATPESLVMTEHQEDLKSIAGNTIPIEEAILLEVGGVRGSFAKLRFTGKENSVRVVWSTYRYFQSKAQRIFISITAPETELPKIMKVLHSLELQ
jgi:hypothetical protein